MCGNRWVAAYDQTLTIKIRCLVFEICVDIFFSFAMSADTHHPPTSDLSSILRDRSVPLLKGLGIQGLGQAFFAEFAIHPRLSVIPSVSLLKSSVALDTRVYLSPVTDPWRKFFALRTSSRKNMSLSTGVKVWGCVTLMGGVYTPACNEAYKPFLSIGVELL